MATDAEAYRRREIGSKRMEEEAKKIQPLRPLSAADTDLEYLSAADGGLAHMSKGGNPKHHYPYAEAHEQARLNAIKMLGLHEHNTAQDRAKAMGYDLETYHGTDAPDIESLDPERTKIVKGVFSTTHPSTASRYAEDNKKRAGEKSAPNIIPLLLKSASHKGMSKFDINTINSHRERGDKGAYRPEMQIAVTFDPSQMRSRFAAFDPAREHETHLLAANGGQVDMDRMRLELMNGKKKFLEPSVEKGVMYHGTASNIKQFKNIPRKQKFGATPKAEAHFVSFDPYVANQFALKNKKVKDFGNTLEDSDIPNMKVRSGANVMPVHAQVTNPFDIGNKEHLKALKQYFVDNPYAQAHLPEFAKQQQTKIIHSGADFAHKNAETKEDNYVFLESPHVQDAIKKMGHDAFYTYEMGARNLGIFDPKKIKSAIGNRGTYDINDPDITKAEGGAVNPFDYENPEHVSTVAGHVSKHKDFKDLPEAHTRLGEVLSSGSYKHLEDPRVQMGLRKAGHNAYYTQEKTGKKLNKMVINKAMGGAVPSVNAMRAEMMGKKPTSLSDLSTIGANEAPSMNVKAYVPPAMDGQNLPVGGVSMGNQPLPIGGIDMNKGQQGQQLMPAGMAPPPQGQQSPLSAGASSPAQQPPSNILQMTPQGQALNAMTPPQQPAKMADGGGIPMTYKAGGSDNMDMPDPTWEPDDGEKTFNIDNLKLLASGGSVDDEDNSTVMTHDHGYADGGLVPEEMEPPKKTVKAYKLFRVHKKHPGKLFPLFVNADKPVEMDKWQQAEIGEMAGKKVKSKIGPLAFRPGWHAGDLPIATHIGEKDEEQKMEQARIRELRNKAVKKHGDKKLANQTYPYPKWTNAPRLRNPNHVWAEVDMPNDVNWQKEAEKRGMNAQGKLIAKNAHITDQIPHGGHYRYKTNSNMKGNWLIGGGMKVNRILSDDEVKAINKAAKAKDLPRAKKQKLADYGFAKGGSTKGYLHHTDINPNPEVGKRFGISGVGEGLAPINEVNPETMMGGSFGIAPWDRSGSHTVNEVSGHELINPAKLQAGQNFPRMLKNVAEGRGGASGPKVVEAQQDRISRAISHNLGKKGTGKVYTSPSTMALGSEYFSHMPIEIQLDLMHQAGLHPDQIARLNEMVKKEKGMQDFVGFEHPSLWEHITSGDTKPLSSPGKVRKAMSKVLSSKEGQQMLNYNEEDLLNAIEDPDLRGVPKGYAGRILLQGHPNEIRGTPFMDPNHESYSQGHRQKFVGGAQNAPIELWMPESFKKQKAMLLAKNKDLAKGKGFRDQIINSLAWSKAPHSYQMITEPVVQNLSRYKEGIKAGDIDPNNLPAVLDYFKRKHGGYKKGGKVKLSTNMDTINLELSRRTKKAK
jgi:hypothetical protein